MDGMLTDIELAGPLGVLLDLDCTYNDHGMSTGIDQVGLPGPASESFDYDLPPLENEFLYSSPFVVNRSVVDWIC